MPEDMHRDIIRNLYSAQGYCDSKGLYSARVAIYQHYQQRGLYNLDVDNIYIGNGVSELIQMVTQALLNNELQLSSLVAIRCIIYVMKSKIGFRILRI